MVEEIENWSEVLDRMSSVIRRAEIEMRSKGLTIPVECGRLSWRLHGKNMRICLDTKPLIEHSAYLRAQFYEEIPKLIKAANDEMTRMFGHVRDSQFGI